MRKTQSTLPVLVLVSVALCAADLGHGAVAVLTRHGLIAGPYSAYNHASIVPALLAALILTTISTLGIFGGVIARAAGLRADWLADSAERIARIRFFALTPIIFSVQLALLLAMESAEQTAAFGHPLGFVAAIGAPPALALGVHLLAALTLAGAAGLLSRAIVFGVRSLAQAVGPLIRRLLIATSSAPAARRQRVGHHLEGKRVAPLARRIASRPPPFAIPVA